MTSAIEVLTPYASFDTMSREIGQNGGSWFDFDRNTIIIAHQSMGGATDLIQFKEHMSATVDIPANIAQTGDTIS